MAWRVEAAPAGRPDAVGLLRLYWAEIVGRYHGRPASDAEVDAVMAELPSDRLHSFLVLSCDGEPAGCAGVSLVAPGVAELYRVFVAPAFRRLGGAGALLAAAEAAARELGADVLRLEVRADLVEARGLYAARGFAEVEPFSHGPYADHWFEKRLSGGG